MNLTEKERLLHFAKQTKTKDSPYRRDDSDARTYLLDADDARHLDSQMRPYSSMEMKDLEQNLRAVWPEAEYEDCIILLLIAYLKAQSHEPRALPEVELHNYMM